MIMFMNKDFTACIAVWWTTCCWAESLLGPSYLEFPQARRNLVNFLSTSKQLHGTIQGSWFLLASAPSCWLCPSKFYAQKQIVHQMASLVVDFLFRTKLDSTSVTCCRNDSGNVLQELNDSFRGFRTPCPTMVMTDTGSHVCRTTVKSANTPANAFKRLLFGHAAIVYLAANYCL